MMRERGRPYDIVPATVCPLCNTWVVVETELRRRLGCEPHVCDRRDQVVRLLTDTLPIRR